MNPMGREHVPAYLDQLIALDAEGIAQRAISGVLQSSVGPPLRLGLVLSDDALGGWTNRWAGEFSHIMREPVLSIKHGFITPILWTRDAPSGARVREEVLATIHRYAHVLAHGAPKTLQHALAQERYALAQAGVAQWLDGDDLAYTREVLRPHRDAADQPTLMAALFGDEAARDLGYAPLGLSARAGLALALEWIAL